MPTYRITLAQQLLETATIEIDAASHDLAEKRALELAAQIDLEWETEAAGEVYVLQTSKED